jgi:hypothetical protein
MNHCGSCMLILNSNLLLPNKWPKTNRYLMRVFQYSKSQEFRHYTKHLDWLQVNTTHYSESKWKLFLDNDSSDEWVEWFGVKFSNHVPAFETVYLTNCPDVWEEMATRVKRRRILIFIWKLWLELLMITHKRYNRYNVLMWWWVKKWTISKVVAPHFMQPFFVL